MTAQSKELIFSGMQPSSDSLHLGNYIGALTNWVSLQDSHQAIFCVVNQHAITVPQDPKELIERTRITAAQYLAAGIDPEKSILFVQSQVAEHSQLAWVLNTITGFGEANRMTQFKDKSSKQGADNTSVGLFTYPILMAADILLYQANAVPVGDDQKQHLELTRDLANRFNSRFGETFVVPEPFIPKTAARIYDLQEPESKMSKSAASESGLIKVLDDEKVTEKKIKRAVTDTDGEIRYDPKAKPGVSNLLSIYASLSKQSLEQTVEHFASEGYGKLKTELAELVIAELSPVRKKTSELLADKAELDRILNHGAERARELAQKTLALVYERIGFPNSY